MHNKRIIIHPAPAGGKLQMHTLRDAVGSAKELKAHGNTLEQLGAVLGHNIMRQCVQKHINNQSCTSQQTSGSGIENRSLHARRYLVLQFNLYTQRRGCVGAPGITSSREVQYSTGHVQQVHAHYTVIRM